jgi:hypothetical protein
MKNFLRLASCLFFALGCIAVMLKGNYAQAQFCMLQAIAVALWGIDTK